MFDYQKHQRGKLNVIDLKRKAKDSSQERMKMYGAFFVLCN